jgi:hypothetical protein
MPAFNENRDSSLRGCGGCGRGNRTAQRQKADKSDAEADIAEITSGGVWFALSRRSTLERHVKQVLERAGQVITVYKRGSKVAASKESFRSGKLKAIQSKEDWSQSLVPIIQPMG